MKKIINAFTFIEVLFVITIISFLSVSAISYFNNFVDTKKLDTDLYMIRDSIDKLDLKVKNKEIYDYEINFSGSNYLYKLNQSVNPIKTIFSIDEITKEFTMTSGLTYTWSWDIKIYNEEKLLSKKTLDLKETFTWKMDLYNSYDVKSIPDLYNDFFWIYLFSEDNLDTTWITTDFLWVNTKSDKSWSWTQNFTLKNINNKLQFYSWSSFWNVQDIYLFFWKAWVEKSIKISNN